MEQFASPWAFLRVFAAAAFAIVGLALTFAPTPAWATWSQSGAGTATAGTATLNAPTATIVSSSVNTDTVSVSWTGATLSTGGLVNGYRVYRIRTSDSATFNACGTSASALVTSASCTDTGVVDGTYRYVVASIVGSWTATGAISGSVSVVNNSTLPSIGVSTVSPAANTNGYNNSSPVSVTLTTTAGSAGSAVVSIRYTIDAGSLVTVASTSTVISVSGAGTRTLSFTCVDSAGRVSAAGSFLVRIDTVAPAAPSAPVMTAATDTGLFATDAVTRSTVPQFSGTAEVGSTVVLLSGTTVLGSAVAADGTYLIASSALAEGSKTITAKATDLAGNVSAASTGTAIVVDTTAPLAPSTPALATASDTGRSSTDKITNLATPTLTGTTTAGTTVTFYDGTTAVGSATTATTSFSITTSALLSGTRSVTATATDLAGNPSVASTAVTFTIDLTPPAAPSTPTLSSSSDTGSSPTDNITSVTTPTVTGSNESKAIVLLYDGAVQVGSRTSNNKAYSITSSALANGVHSLTATSTDVAGNVSVASAARVVTIDTVAPVAPSAPLLVTASDTGISSTDGITKLQVLTVSGTIETGVRVTVKDGTTTTGVVSTSAAGVYTNTTASLAAGTHSLTAIATDLAGNVGTSSAASTIVIDLTAPTVTINKAATQADPTTARPVLFTAVFSETAYWLAGPTVSGTAGATTGTAGGTGTSLTVSVATMTRTGTVVVTVPVGGAQDTAGNSNTVSTSTDNSVDYTDVLAPVVSLSTFVLAPAQAVTVSGVGGVLPGDATTVTIVLCAQNVSVCAVGDTIATLTANVTPVTGTFSVTSGTLGARATVYAWATQTDLTGNAGRSSTLGPLQIV